MATAGYSGTPLWRKLGYKDGLAAFVDQPPEGYMKLLGLPKGVKVAWLAAPRGGMAFVHLFATSAAWLRARLRVHRARIDRAGAIWVSWPKQARQHVICEHFG